jgi:hypothetical protein
MISEVVNALFLTYLATEYLVATNNDSNNNSNRRSDVFAFWPNRLFQKHIVAAAVTVCVVNLLDRLTGATIFANGLFHGFLHVPKIIFAAVCYVVTLYADCQRVSRNKLALRVFMQRVGWAFLAVLPAYPFLAVMISFGFLLVINLFEFFELPLEWLNWPIYYGTLYGPFSFCYWKVKQRVVQDRNTLPSSSSSSI